MRTAAFVLLTVLALAAVAAPTPGGSPRGADASFTVTATGTGCPEGRTFCYQVENASSELTPGEEVTIRFENEDDVGHTLYVANGSRSEAETRDTSEEAALAHTREVEPGASASLNITVPGGDAVYLWCEVDDHEPQGMWTEMPVDAASENASGPDQGSRRVPTVPGGALVAAVGGAAWLADRDRARRPRGVEDGQAPS